MDTVLKKMREICNISEETETLLRSVTTPFVFPKKYKLIVEGAFCKYAYFLEKGMTRSYWVVDGEEITTSFSCPGGIVFSMDELYYNQLSEEYVETIEKVKVYRIELSMLTHLMETNLELSNWGRIIHQDEYRRLHRSHKELLTLSASERYEQMQKQFPMVCERANLGYIASYLGMTLPTLSRIRGNK